MIACISRSKSRIVKYLKAFGSLTAPVMAASLLLASHAAAQEVKFFRIGTDATATSLFAVGAVIAAGISNPPGSRACKVGGSCGVPGLIAAAQSTDGAVQNIELLRRNRIDSAFVQADLAYWAYHGTGFYQEAGPMRDLRVIASLLPLALHIVVRADSGIGSVADLAGRKVSLGPERSGSRINAGTVLRTYGIDEGDIEPVFLNPGPASDALAAGTIDAFFEVGAYPVPAIASLARRMPIRLLPIDGVPGEELKSFYPFFSEVTIPADSYDGLAATPTVGVAVQWVILAGAEESFVEDLTAALWHENTRRLLTSGHPFGARVKREDALWKVAVPLHPGADKWYRAAGLK